uniref:small monomeric GTPase n=1 Tax=Entamoeba invadens TaxID=33085 RepID=S0B557_ENTIV|nr:hypothetical protein, conserved [Entamoeba invadens]
MSVNAVMTKKIVVTFTGAAGVGKTQMLNVITRGTFTTIYEPTVQEQFNMRTVYGGQIYSLTLIDTSGTSDYAKLTSVAMSSSDCVVICYCPYIPRSFDRVIEAAKEARTISPDIPVIIIATKIDLKDDKETLSKLGKQKVRSQKEVKAELKKTKISAYLETSVMLNLDTKTILEEIIKATTKSSIWKKKQS